MKSIYFFLISLLMISVASAAQASQSPAELSFWLNIGQGALIGSFTVLVGWAKKQDPGKFDIKGLYLRLPTGIVVGILAAYKGLDFTDAYAWAAGVGIIMIVDNISKMVLRRLGLLKKQKEKKNDKDSVSE